MARRGAPPSDQARPGSITLPGEVIDVFGNGVFGVKLDTGHQVQAHLGGKMRKHFIRVMRGDRVTVELSPYDLQRGRITYRQR
ncbi:MAG TPA: translation initiation factor IF-1 [Chloroflexota bacterium]|nr:translation initiation factor IF-1 [Chloroflexota bacterium]